MDVGRESKIKIALYLRLSYCSEGRKGKIKLKVNCIHRTPYMKSFLTQLSATEQRYFQSCSKFFSKEVSLNLVRRNKLLTSC